MHGAVRVGLVECSHVLLSSFLFFRILEVVESVAIDFPIPENKTSNTVQLKGFTLTVSEITPETFSGFEFAPMSTSVPTLGGTQLPGTPPPPPPPSISLSIPQTILNNVYFPSPPENGSSSPPGARISNTVYQTDVLFRRRSNDSFVVGSVVGSATLSVGSVVVRVSNLEPPITLVFAKRADVLNGSNVSCNFWNFAADGELGSECRAGVRAAKHAWHTLMQMDLETGPLRTAP